MNKIKVIEQTPRYQCPICKTTYDNIKSAEQCMDSKPEKPFYTIGDVCKVATYSNMHTSHEYLTVKGYCYADDIHKTGIVYEFEETNKQYPSASIENMILTDNHKKEIRGRIQDIIYSIPSHQKNNVKCEWDTEKGIHVLTVEFNNRRD